MRFARPDILWAMLIIMPLLTAFLWWTWRERQALITQFIHARLLPVLTVGVSRSRQKLRLTLLAGVVALTLLALSRPQWGFGFQEVKQRGLDIVVGIDTSRSMLAEDVSPNRLEKAKLAAQDLRRLAKTDRMGLVAFAGSAFLQMPMSLDENTFRQHLNALSTTLLPQGGTALAEAIQTARTAFKEAGEENHRALVLFTDGEDHDGQAIEAAAKAAKEGMVVFTIGMGSPGGELIPVRDAKGRIDFIKDENGNAVKSRLNENLLQDIAKAGNGFYLHLSGANGMDLLYERGLSTLPKRDLTATMMRRYFERFQWFLALAWLLLIVEMFIPEFKAPPRPKAPPLAPPRPAQAASLLLLLLSAAMVLTSGDLGASPSSARRDYEAGKFKNALNEYESLLERKPKDPALNYNAGAAAYQAGRLRNASEHFEAALATQDPKLQQRAYYNLGNTTFKLGEDAGEPAKTQELWQKSINHFESALKLDPQDADAQHNLKWVQEKLEELKKQQQQQQQNSDQNQKDDKKEQDKNKQEDQQNQQDQKQSGDSKDKNGKDQEQSQNDPNKGSPEQEDQDPSKSDPAKQPKPDEQGDQKDSQQQQAKDEAKNQEGKEQPAGQNDRDKQEGKEGKAGQATDPSDPNSKAGEAQAARPLQMTQREAIRLLEALRSEERLFLPPPPQKPKKNPRRVKDW